MANGLYDLVKEYAIATSERKSEIEAQRRHLFPSVEGWPQFPDMIYCEVAQNVWGWDRPRASARYMDNSGRVVGS